MKLTRAATALLALVLVPATGAAQGEFEGTVTYKMSGQGMNMDVVHHIRGEKVRQEMSGPMGAMAMIIDMREGTMTTLMPAQKMYMTMDLTQMAEQARQMAGRADEPVAEPEITEMDRSETIAGHRCQYYLMQTPEVTTEICAATGLGFYMASQNAGMAGGRGGAAPRGNPWNNEQAAKLRARFKDGFFPLKMIIKPAGGDGGMTMEVTSLERKSVSEELFTIPAGFTKLPGMPGN